MAGIINELMYWLMLEERKLERMRSMHYLVSCSLLFRICRSLRMWRGLWERTPGKHSLERAWPCILENVPDPAAFNLGRTQYS